MRNKVWQAIIYIFSIGFFDTSASSRPTYSPTATTSPHTSFFEKTAIFFQYPKPAQTIAISQACSNNCSDRYYVPDIVFYSRLDRTVLIKVWLSLGYSWRIITCMRWWWGWWCYVLENGCAPDHCVSTGSPAGSPDLTQRSGTPILLHKGNLCFTFLKKRWLGFRERRITFLQKQDYVKLCARQWHLPTILN
jgi:hypothetical protein